MVGAIGFEPTASWSRTGESKNLKPCGCRTYNPLHPKIPALIGTHGTHAGDRPTRVPAILTAGFAGTMRAFQRHLEVF
jgi:hypothetical protein